MNVPAKAPIRGEIMETVIAKGDLSKLTSDERATYYMTVCKSVGLNPLTRPFEYITLQGKLTLYARRDCADQLRKINGISLEIVEQKIHDNLLTVHVRAKDKAGRQDEDFGAVELPTTLKGEARANLVMKAITKAKRRATLSISGLGFLDETEVEDIPAHVKHVGYAPAEAVIDETTGEVIEEFGKPQSSATEATAAPASEAPAGAADLPVEDQARAWAKSGGENALKAFYAERSPAEQKKLRKIEAELIGLYPK